MTDFGIMTLSIVIPVHNEELNIAPLYNAIVSVPEIKYILTEVIFVDDGSKDQTKAEIKKLVQIDKRVKSITLNSNLGQSFATMQGIQSSTGKMIAILDGDMQNDPKDLPKMIAYLYEGYDLVCGWRKNRKDKWLSVTFSRIANMIIRVLFRVKIHDSGCSLRVGYAQYFKQIRFFEHFHRYIPIILSMQHLRVAEMEVDHYARFSGQSKYNLSKSFVVIKELLYLRFFY